jgi:hypothetical protein
MPNFCDWLIGWDANSCSLIAENCDSTPFLPEASLTKLLLSTLRLGDIRSLEKSIRKIIFSSFRKYQLPIALLTHMYLCMYIHCTCLRARVTKQVYEKITQNVGQPINCTVQK